MQRPVFKTCVISSEGMNLFWKHRGLFVLLVDCLKEVKCASTESCERSYRHICFMLAQFDGFVISLSVCVQANGELVSKFRVDTAFFSCSRLEFNITEI